MIDDDAALIRRMADCAQGDPCQVARADLMRLMMLAQLDDIAPFSRLVNNPHDTIIMSADIVRNMIRLVLARNNDALPSARTH